MLRANNAIAILAHQIVRHTRLAALLLTPTCQRFGPAACPTAALSQSVNLPDCKAESPA